MKKLKPLSNHAISYIVFLSTFKMFEKKKELRLFFSSGITRKIHFLLHHPLHLLCILLLSEKS